jgi:hypothetical protein
VNIWLLWHTAIEDGDTDSKIIGVYSSIERAKDAAARLAREPGFRDAREVVDEADKAGFFIAKYVVDVDQWTAGFRSDS